MERATQGYLSVDRHAPIEDTAPLPHGEMPTAWEKRWLARAGEEEVSAKYALTAYDGAWAWAKALHEMVTVRGYAIDKLTSSQASMKELYSIFLTLDFKGVSGNVKFDPTGDRVGMATRIDNKYNGTMNYVGWYKNGDILFNTTSPLVWGGSVKNGSSSWTGIGKANAPTDGDGEARPPPDITSVYPALIHPSGGKTLVITGVRFSFGVITVVIGFKECLNPILVDAQTVSCISPSGYGGNIPITISFDGIKSVARPLLSYFLPNIFSISRGWAVHGSEVAITGR